MKINFGKITKNDVELYIENLWKKVDSIDKKSFWVFFISLNIVYLYNSIHCLFGNEDVYSMFRSVDIALCNFMGRYSATWLEYIFSNKTIIPMFANIICFFFLSLSTTLMLNWLKLKKTLFNYLLAGLFILLVPFLQAYMWFRSISFGVLLMPFFIIISFLICEMATAEKGKIKKIVYFFCAVCILSVFTLGTNTPVIGTICGLLLSKILIECIDSDYSKLKSVIFKYRYFYILILFSVIVHFLVLKVLTIAGILDLSFYNIKLITFKQIGTTLLPFLVNTVNYFLFFTFPYVGIPYKLALFLLVLVSFIGIGLYLKRTTNSKKEYISKLIITFLCYTFLFYIFNIVYFLSPELGKFKRFFRLEYYTTAYFVFVCIVVGLKYANNWIKNIFFGLLFVILFVSIQINMHIQKDQFIGQQVEIDRIMTLKNIILGNENYEYSNEIKYDYIQIGDITFSVVEEIYNANSFSAEFNKTANSGFHNPDTRRRDLPIELFSTFQNGEYAYIQTIVDMPPRIININPYSVKHIALYKDMEKYVDSELRNWLLTIAKAYPSPNCVFINKGKIYAIMNQNLLDGIKFELRK